jgi:hypothetical protein
MLGAGTLLLLEEYRALRAEITSSLQAQHAALSYGAAALGAIFFAVATTWSRAPGFSAVALMSGVPLGVAFLLFVWGTELSRMKRIGAYIRCYLEPRINSSVSASDGEPVDYLAYERWLAGELPPSRRRRTDRTFTVAVGAAFCVLLASSSFAVGAARLDAHVAADRQSRSNYLFRHWEPSLTPLEGLEFWLAGGVFLVLPFTAGLMILSRTTSDFGKDELPNLSGRNS